MCRSAQAWMRQHWQSRQPDTAVANWRLHRKRLQVHLCRLVLVRTWAFATMHNQLVQPCVVLPFEGLSSRASLCSQGNRNEYLSPGPMLSVAKVVPSLGAAWPHSPPEDRVTCTTYPSGCVVKKRHNGKARACGVFFQDFTAGCGDR